MPQTTVLEELVVLVDERGNPTGQQSKATVHSGSTPRHLAFSLYLFDLDQRLLMTRRALTKVTWPGVWTNTCCGHPMPGESMADAVDRRLEVELGLQVRDLRPLLPDFAYRVQDVSGIWENEVCPVFRGTLAPGATGRIRPNPSEVMDWAWAAWPDVVTAMTATPFAYSPWAVQQVGLLDALERVGA